MTDTVKDASGKTRNVTWSWQDGDLVFDFAAPVESPVVPADVPTLNVLFLTTTRVPIALDWAKPTTLDIALDKGARLRGTLTLRRSIRVDGGIYSAVYADIRLKLDDLFGERRFVGVMAAWSPPRPVGRSRCWPDRRSEEIVIP